MNTRPKPNQPIKTNGMLLWQILSLVMLVVLAVVCVPVVAVLYLGWINDVIAQDSTNVTVTEITLVLVKPTEQLELTAVQSSWPSMQ